MIVLAAAGILSSVLQNPPRLVLERIRPRSLALVYLEGLAAHVRLAGTGGIPQGLFKLAAVSLLGFMVLRSAQNSVVNVLFMEPAALPTLILEMASRLIATVAVATIVLVAADVVWSRVYWQRELRMTRQEIKDEMKQADGDPLVKARLRSLARDRCASA